MPVAKLTTGLDEMKSEEGNDSLDTFIRQAIGKEPLIPFTRTGDSPVQWIQLLHALDQPDLPGWPLLTPVKVQMQKCEKCSREFCSPINYRRHIRVHRRSLNVDKESHKNRDLLAVFWDELSLQEATDIVSLNDVMLKEIPGSSIARALASSLRKPGVWTLPQVYVKAGSTLLDVINAKSSRLPISSQELFSILDDASERTFLCAGTAESLQKYVFDGEAAKNSLELKNLIACTGFLFEQQLVKAWVANKDAEALRCQKLLVEEEEAAQKRQAELLKRKKQKKLRQKEQKVKEQLGEVNGFVNVTVDAADGPVLAEASGPPSPSDSGSNSPDVPKILDSYLDSFHYQIKGSEKDIESEFDFSCEHITQGDFLIIETQMVGENDHPHSAINRWQIPKSHKTSRYGFQVSKNLQKFKPEPVQKLGPSRDCTLVSGSKVWTKKFQMNSVGGNLKPMPQGEVHPQIEEANCEVMIGSISVALKICDSGQHDCPPEEAQDAPSTEHAMLKKNIIPEKPIKADSIQSGSNLVASMRLSSVCQGEARGTSPVEREDEESDGGVMLSMIHDHFLSDERFMQSQSISGHDDCDSGKHSCPLSDETPQQKYLPFSSIAAKEFLAQRWKKALSADHVKLVLSSGEEPPGCSGVQCDHLMTSQASDLREISVLVNSENQPGGASQGKSRTKPEKSLKIKYIPKQKAVVYRIQESILSLCSFTIIPFLSRGSVLPVVFCHKIGVPFQRK